MKPTSKCPYFAEEFDDCPACDHCAKEYNTEHVQNIFRRKSYVTFYCDINAADKDDVIDAEEYKYDKEH